MMSFMYGPKGEGRRGDQLVWEVPEPVPREVSAEEEQVKEQRGGRACAVRRGGAHDQPQPAQTMGLQHWGFAAEADSQ